MAAFNSTFPQSNQTDPPIAHLFLIRKEDDSSVKNKAYEFCMGISEKYVRTESAFVKFYLIDIVIY